MEYWIALRVSLSLRYSWSISFEPGFRFRHETASENSFEHFEFFAEQSSSELSVPSADGTSLTTLLQKRCDGFQQV